ncbi:hypothetical protein Pint_31739 [Pistacia integerrima]|uniref:Uncharacterized protein n=1 Tax=Pistacia integerrima TaxID=434235 RepID=A0ACC0XSG0_9ROSI|nr:hypothetical protein Pint_31739 [Pistacia integerrima]
MLDPGPSKALLNGALHWATKRYDEDQQVQVHCLGNNKGIEIFMNEYNVKDSWMKKYVIGTYVPSSLRQDMRMNMDSQIWKERRLGKGGNRVICILKNGDILLEIENGALVSYDPAREEFKELLISGLPKWFCTIVHVESLFQVEANLQKENTE